MPSFSSIPLPSALHASLETLGYVEMTPVQAASLPAIVAGRDVIAQAPTGSGKTVAFGLGLLHRLDVSLVKPQALVLCPTRELADQVAKEIRRLAAAIPNLKVLTLTGGVALGPQLASLRKDSHVIVGTPGRVQEMLKKQALSLAKAKTLVLDEADRMLDMGFEDAIRDIGRHLPPKRQGLLFSATFPDDIRAIGRDLLREPLEIAIEGADEKPAIDERFFETELARKPAALVALLARPDSAARLRPLLNRDPLAEALGREGGGDGAPGRPLVEAKTGTLNFVSNLAGYARGPDGAERAFAVMVADLPRRAATEGQELPEGVLGWTARAKRLQRDVVAAACAGAEPTGPLPPEI